MKFGPQCIRPRQRRFGGRRGLFSFRPALALGCALAFAPAIARAAAFDASPFRPYVGDTITGVSLQGNRVTRPNIVMREIAQHQGAVLDTVILAEDATRLENMQVFSSMRFTPSADSGGVALALDVTEMPPLLLLPALSYNEQNGFSIGVGASALNIAGRGIRLTGSALVGGVNTFQASLINPWIAGDHVSLDARIAHLQRQDELNQFKETSDELTVWVRRYFGDYGRIGGALSYLSMNSDVASKTLSSSNTDQLFRVGASIGFDSRNSWRSPRRGWETEIAGWRTGGPLGGQGDFWSMDVDLRRYQPIAENQTFTLGALLSEQTGQPGVDLPSYMTYYIGGANSVRGYSVDDAREVNGKNQFITTAEYAVNALPITEYHPLGMAFSLGLDVTGFVDLGTAWTNENAFNPHSLRQGGGIGLRLLVPGIDAIRVEFGINDHGGTQWHLATRWKLTAERQRIR
jgi:outer membrane protein insertion porin family